MFLSRRVGFLLTTVVGGLNSELLVRRLAFKQQGMGK